MVSIRKHNATGDIAIFSWAFLPIDRDYCVNLLQTFVRFRNPGYHNLYKSQLQAVVLRLELGISLLCLSAYGAPITC
jgi:hypothetical protein